jgi:hypothetical protein
MVDLFVDDVGEHLLRLGPRHAPLADRPTLVRSVAR